MIKGGFFGKSLKQLFIIGLISCFTLLVGSSVSAYSCTSNGTSCWGMEFGQGNNSAGYKGIVIDHNFNFSGNVFEINSLKSSVSTRFLSYWWQSDGLYYTKQNWNYSNQLNGKIDGFYVCNSQPQTSENVYLLSQINICTYNLGFTNFGNYIKTFDLYGRQEIVSVSKSNLILCMYSSEGSSYICVDTSSTSNNNGSFLSTSSINQVAINNPFSKSFGTSFTPSTGSRLGGRLITSSGYTNNQMVKAYECVGLLPALCYGGYPITDIFEPSETFEDFTGYTAGQGATIFDLYNRYSGSFSNINQFLNTVLTRYQNGQINQFKTEPKALLMLGAQMNTAGFKTSYISTYCDLLLNKNNTSTYTGNSVDDLRAQSCYRSQHINDSLKNSDGSDIIGQGSDVGIFGSGEDVDFDPETFFSNMMEKISSGLDNVSTGTAVGVIPGYIILFTLALIFIRLISH